MRKLLLLVGFILPVLSSFKKEKTTDMQALPVIEKNINAVQVLIPRYSIPDASVLMAKNEKPVYVKSYGFSYIMQ